MDADYYECLNLYSGWFSIRALRTVEAVKESSEAATSHPSISYLATGFGRCGSTNKVGMWWTQEQELTLLVTRWLKCKCLLCQIGLQVKDEWKECVLSLVIAAWRNQRFWALMVQQATLPKLITEDSKSASVYWILYPFSPFISETHLDLNTISAKRSTSCC